MPLIEENNRHVESEEKFLLVEKLIVISCARVNGLRWNMVHITVFVV